MQRDIPIGTIQSWSGSIASIPSTWRLCDGSEGTPDLRNKFVVGAGDTYGPGARSGSVDHTHPFTGDSHYHTLKDGADLGAGAEVANYTDINEAVGTTDGPSALIPYYALCYIMYKGVI